MSISVVRVVNAWSGRDHNNPWSRHSGDREVSGRKNSSTGTEALAKAVARQS